MFKMETFVRYIILFCTILINFIVSSLIINAVQFILHCTLKPFSKYLFRKINYYAAYALYCHFVFLVQWFSNSDIFIYVEPKDLEYFGKEHACIIMNHGYEIDWMFFFAICNKFHVLGNIKGYIKKTVKYVPSLGWNWYFSENVFLTRSIKQDEIIIKKQVSEIVQTPDPIWLILCPEGTRYNTIKHKESMAIAQKKGLPLLKHHLLPKPKGFLTSLPIFRNNVGAIYDSTITLLSTSDVKPTFINLLLGKKLTCHVYIKRIPLEQVPDDEKEATAFLNSVFVRKDKLLDSFFNTGDFFLESGITRIEPYKLSKSYRAMLHISIWFFLTIVPLWYYIFQCLYLPTFSNLLIIICGFCLITILFHFGLQMNSVKTDKH